MYDRILQEKPKAEIFFVSKLECMTSIQVSVLLIIVQP